MNRRRSLDSRMVQELKRAALDASKNSYSPYSHFPVGAAVLMETGEIFAGCNVENSSYGLTICAERNAVFQAVAKGARRIVAIAVVTNADQPTPPCGACRQVLSEFGPDAEVLSFTEGGKVLRSTLSLLLPHSFGSSDLSHKSESRSDQIDRGS